MDWLQEAIYRFWSMEGRVFFVIFQTRQFVNYIPNLRNTHMKNENNFENEQTYFFGKEKYWVGEGAASNEKRNQK